MPQGSPGYNADFYLTGTSTSMTDEACTEVSGTVFQITDSAKRILDHDVAITVKANTVVQSGNYTINENTGTVTFTDGSHTGETIELTANYLPRHQVAKIAIGNVDLSFDSQDSQEMQESGESNTLTTLTAAVSVESIRPLDDDVFSTTDLSDIFFAAGIKVLEFQPTGSSNNVLRVRGQFDNANFAHSGPSDIVRGTLNLQGTNAGATMVSWDTV